MGRIDILVTSAGISHHRAIVEMTESEWDRVIAVNLKGTFKVRAVAPHMVRQKTGKIVTIASELAFIGRAEMAHYCASKGGVIALTKALARELAPGGINVNSVAPGPTETDMLRANPDEYRDEVRATIPLRRWGQPRDVALTVLFLVSEAGAYYAGQVLNIEILRGMGVNTLLVDAKGLKELQPFMETDDVGGAAYEPESGYADPSDCIGSLLAGVKKRRGRVILEAGPVHILTTQSRIAGVKAGTEEIAAPNVVIAAGVGARDLAAQVGLDLPVFPMPIGAGLLHRSAALGSPMCVIDHAVEQWYRGEVGDLMLIGAGYEDSIGFKGEPFHGKAELTPPTLEELVTDQRGPNLPGLRRGPAGGRGACQPLSGSTPERRRPPQAPPARAGRQPDLLRFPSFRQGSRGLGYGRVLGSAHHPR